MSQKITIVARCTYHEYGRFVRLTVSIRLRGILSAFDLSQFYIDLTGCSTADGAEEFTLEAGKSANNQMRKVNEIAAPILTNIAFELYVSFGFN